MKCSANKCENDNYTKGLCNKHYKRLWRYGDVSIVKYDISGYPKHRLLRVRRGIIERCYKLNHQRYKDWGGRGITVCDEWKNSAKAFIDWCLKNGWKQGLQIDRRNNDGNYCPENCRFVAAQINNCNTKLLRKDNTSGYRGVSWNKQRKKWTANISINSKRKYLGHFYSSRIAALRYDVEAYLLNDGRPMNFII